MSVPESKSKCLAWPERTILKGSGERMHGYLRPSVECLNSVLCIAGFNKCRSEQTGGWTVGGRMGAWVDGQVEGGWVGRWMDGRLGRWMDGWMSACVDGWMCAWTDGQMDK